ncbi:MAG: tetratricopeptide repeat protein, partial [Desulfobulbia bacterium]
TNAEAHFYLASIHYDNLDFDKAEKNFTKAIKHLQRIECLPSKVRLCELNIFLTRLCKNQSIPELDSVLPEAKKNKLKVYGGWTYRIVSEIFTHVNSGNFEEAEVWIKKAIESDESTGNKWSLARNYMVYTKILTQKGHEAEAKKCLMKAESIFKSCGADGWITRLNDGNLFRIKYK